MIAGYIVGLIMGYIFFKGEECTFKKLQKEFKEDRFDKEREGL